MRELPAINLDGFNPSSSCEHMWGAAVVRDGRVWKEHQYHAEILGRFDHDYLGTHLFVQVWDYAQQDDPDQRWQYVLLLDRPQRFVGESGCIEYTEWAWCIRTEYEHDETNSYHAPTFAQVGADVDVWLQAPEVLRFILE